MFRLILSSLFFLYAVACWATDSGTGQRVTHLIAQGDPSQPQWGVQLRADSVTFRNPVDGSNVTANATDIANSIPTGDWGIPAWMLTPFPASTTAYVYFENCPNAVAPAKTVQGIISQNPPSVGPTLTAGCTAYAFAYSVRITGSGDMPIALNVTGNTVFFGGFSYQVVWNFVPPSGGPTSPTWIKIWPWIPDNAETTCTWWDAEYQTNVSGGNISNIAFVVLGQIPAQAYALPSTTGIVPNTIVCSPVDQGTPSTGIGNNVQFYSGGGYANFTGLFLGFQILSYTVANGGS